uniref:DeoR/GlpR transcriptional regulator n=1 Tax=Phenylobacterium glaciei TaxID=2803784 RepID=A0A974P4Y0_9CAUL|nr:DeoR/GlpR transcriptional regulator [Phenylobacterium glaciei]
MVRVKTPISKQQRQEQILAEVRANAAVRIADLADRFGTSTETIRRDLDLLGRQGLLNRTHGGGTPPLAFEADIRDRHRLMSRERWRIAQAAAALVEPGEAIMIDAGSTTLHLAIALADLNRPMVAVTNGLAIADALGKCAQIRVIVCPGELNAPRAAWLAPRPGSSLNASTPIGPSSAPAA